MKCSSTFIIALLMSTSTLGQDALLILDPVPVPDENPVTEAKRILGKILFWDEQLSSDNTVACGTCHKPGIGGADDRLGVNPGIDFEFNTDDHYCPVNY